MKKVLAGMLAFVMVFALMPKFANVEAITETQANLVLDGHVLELSYNVQNSGQEQAAYSELLTKLTQWSQGNWWASNPNLSFRFIEFPNVPGRAAVDISSTAQATFTNFEHNTRYLMKVYALYSNSSGQYMELVKDWVYLTLRNDNSTPTNKIINVPELVLDCSTLQKETQSYADLYAWLKLKSDAQNNYWVNAQMLYYIMKEFPADIPNADSLSVANVDWYSAPLIGDLHVGKGLDFDKRYLLCPATSWYTGTEPSQPSSKIEGLEFFYLTLQQSVPTTMPTPTPLIAPTPTPFIAPTPTPLVLIEDFKDIPKIHWGYEDAKWAIESGLMNGVYSDTFEPDGTLTRGMLVTILGRYEGVDVESYKAKKSFTDVASGEWYHPYVEWAKEKDIVTGIEPTYFAPNAKISRQDLATILLRYMKYKGYDTNKSGGTFVDEAQIASYAKEAVKVLSGYEIINGMGANDFQPTGEATRAQVAKMFRVFDKNITNK